MTDNNTVTNIRAHLQAQKAEYPEAEFEQFYQELLKHYPRHRALRRELAAKVNEEYTK